MKNNLHMHIADSTSRLPAPCATPTPRRAYQPDAERFPSHSHTYSPVFPHLRSGLRERSGSLNGPAISKLAVELLEPAV